MFLIGKIRWFRDDKGFGFIARRWGPDIYVHYASVQAEGYRTLHKGQHVCFEIARGKKGLVAINVLPLDMLPLDDPQTADIAANMANFEFL